MNKATPIESTIETRPGGIQYADCEHDQIRITRAVNMWNGASSLPWWHIETRRITCKERN